MRKWKSPGWVCTLGGALLSVLFWTGLSMETAGSCRAWSFVLAALSALPLALILQGLFSLEDRDRPEADRGRPLFRRFALIFFVQAAAFVIHFPGSFAYDVPFQLRQALTGSYSWHHPIVHTLFLGLFIRLGQLLGRVNLGAALCTLCQMGIMSFLYAKVSLALSRKGKRLGQLALLFYALYPLNPLMAVNATKDTLFGGLFALSMLFLLEERPDKRRALPVLLALCMLLRNNAVYAVFALVFLCLFVPGARRCLLPLGMGLLCYFVLFFSLNALTGAAGTERVEALAVPIQQVARIRVRHGEELSPEERELIDRVMPDAAYERYDETVCDPVKFAMDEAALEENWAECCHLWLGLVCRFPGEAVDAFLALGHPFLFPYPVYRESGYYLQTGVTQDYYDPWWQGERLRDLSPVPRVRQAISWRLGAQGGMQSPVGWLFNLGVLSYLTLILCLRILYRRGRAGICALLPMLLLGTYLLGPCMAGRYLYPFIACLPVLWGGGKEKGIQNET